MRQVARLGVTFAEKVCTAIRPSRMMKVSHAPSYLLALVDSTIKELTHFRDSTLTRPEPVMGYRQYPRLREEVTTVAGMVWRGIHAPTAGETLRTTELKTETDAAQARLDRLIGTRIDAINKLFGTTPRILAPKPRVIS